MPLRLRVNFLKNDRQVEVEVSKADVAKGVGCSALDVLVGVVETVEDDVANVVVGAQVDGPTDLSDGQQ